MTSLARVLTAIAPNIVPTAANPIVASIMTPTTSGLKTGTSKKELYIGRITTSAAPMNVRFAMNFATKIVPWQLGAPLVVHPASGVQQFRDTVFS